MSYILESKSLEKSFKLILHVMGNCNFRCHYCADEHNFGGDSISEENIDEIIKIIQKVSLDKKYSHLDIMVDLTGGEPLLNKNIFKIIDKLQNISQKIRLQLTTNGYLLNTFRNELENIKNKNNIVFNISVHYFYYSKETQKLINNINLLQDLGLNYQVKYLLPDKNISKNEFLDFKQILESGIKNKNHELFSYSLIIMHKTGEISDSYHKDLLEFYYDKNNSGEEDYDENDLKHSRENELVSIKYSDGKTHKYGFGELFDKQLNKFRGYKCFYINKDFISLQIFEDGVVELGGCCKTLGYMKFDVFDLDDLLFGNEKFVECHSKSCTMDLCLTLKKEFYEKPKLLRLLEVKLNQTLEKINFFNFQFLKTEIVENNMNIKLFFLYMGDYICLEIGKNKDREYTISGIEFKDNLYYTLAFPNANFTSENNKIFLNQIIKYHKIFSTLIEKYSK